MKTKRRSRILKERFYHLIEYNSIHYVNIKKATTSSPPLGHDPELLWREDNQDTHIIKSREAAVIHNSGGRRCWHELQSATQI